MDIITPPAWTTVVCNVRYTPFFNAPGNNDVAVQCYGFYGSQLSFENVATQTVLQILDRFDDVALHDHRYRQHKPVAGLEDHSFINPKATVGLFHGLAYKELPEALAGHKYRIGMMVCDADMVPQDSIDICNASFDLLVLPSEFCRHVFVNCGLKVPVLVIPHGVTPTFKPVNSTLPKQFTFYNVYSQLRHFRKSEEELIRCFINAFNRDPAYRLRLRTELTPRLQERLGREYALDVIAVDPETLAEQEYANRLSMVHAVVHPSKAEGFGMIPLQSLACETPVIAPQITGLADYLSAENAMLVQTDPMVPAKDDYAYNAGGRYHAINEGHLTSCLVSIANNWKIEKQKATYYGPCIREKFSWRRVNEPLLDVIAKQLDLGGKKALA